MIIGFPGETDEDFEDTLTLTAAAQFHSMFSFKYSPRPNTYAAQRLADDVTGIGEDDADRRAPSPAEGHTVCLHAASIGTTAEVLVDTTSRRRPWELAGRTTGNTVVNFPGSLSGSARSCQ